jgi:tetratricopeptide (TPR) repeat protein
MMVSIVITGSCSDDPRQVSPPSEPVKQNPPDLSEAIQKRIEGKTDEALAILRKLNDRHPESPEIMTMLGRTLLDAEEYALAAFRLEQAFSLGGATNILSETGQAHELAEDDESAEKAYATYIQKHPDDTFANLKYARVLHRLGKKSKALDAFLQASDKAETADAMAVAQLFLAKEMYPQAEHWFRSAEKKAPNQSPLPYLGLLEIRLSLKDENSAETLILAMEKTHPGSLDKSEHAKIAADLLKRRRRLDFFQRDYATVGKTASQLAAALLAPIKAEPVVGGSKLPPRTLEIVENPKGSPFSIESNASQTSSQDNETTTTLSLADIFSSPPNNSKPAEKSFLDQAELAMLEKNFRSALLFTRRAIRENPKNAAAWHMASQAHFLLGEGNEAEMKSLEATRHAPEDLGYHMDYLRIARETLAGQRYLEELEKAHERFPDSIEILWQLARRYHIAENKPATAAILYRKLLAMAPPDNPLRPEAERELRSLPLNP